MRFKKKKEKAELWSSGVSIAPPPRSRYTSYVFSIPATSFSLRFSEVFMEKFQPFWA